MLGQNVPLGKRKFWRYIWCMTYEDIERLALEMGAQPGTIDKWRRRGVPAIWQIKIIKLARASGVDCDFKDFERKNRRNGS